MESGTSIDDALVWEHARRGDPAALARLAELAVEIARRELRRRGAPASDLDDLVQETSRSTLACLAAGGESPRDLRAFLKFRAWGVLSDLRKKMRTSPTSTAGDAAFEVVARDPGPDRGLRNAQLEAALADCRARLSPEQRVVLEMRYEGGRESEAIASELGLHRNTVHVRVFRALHSLRECLARKGVEAGDLG